MVVVKLLNRHGGGGGGGGGRFDMKDPSARGKVSMTECVAQ